MKCGIHYDVGMADYLAIDALSTTPIRTLIDECPRAGWWRSRLNPNRPRDMAPEMDIGTVAHGILLEGSTASVTIIDPADYPTKSNGNTPKGWTNNEIRAARDAARAAGKTPILADDFAEVELMVAEAQRFISHLRGTEPAIWEAFQPTGGASEVTMVWDDPAAGLCKLRTDRIAKDYGIVIDYKTSGQSVQPDRFGRSGLLGFGYAFGAAWYRRGVRALTGQTPDYVFLAQETTAPYLCSLIGLDPSWIAYSAAKVQAGLAEWTCCLQSGKWDGYPPRVCYPELPPWESAKFEEKLAGIPYDYADLTGREKPES